jgi:hypothetical protein
MAATTHGLDQAMTIEHSVNGRSSGNLDGMWQTPQQTLSDFACAPVRLLPLGSYDGGFHLRG